MEIQTYPHHAVLMYLMMTGEFGLVYLQCQDSISHRRNKRARRDCMWLVAARVRTVWDPLHAGRAAGVPSATWEFGSFIMWPIKCALWQKEKDTKCNYVSNSSVLKSKARTIEIFLDRRQEILKHYSNSLHAAVSFQTESWQDVHSSLWSEQNQIFIQLKEQDQMILK